MLAGKHCSPWVLIAGFAVIILGLVLTLGSVRSHNKIAAPEPPMHVQQ